MSVPCEVLLHPELMSNDQLIQVIIERHLRVPDVHAMPRDQLLELFHHFCVPYGQRRYRDTGRGKILNKARHISPESKSKLDLIEYTPSRKSTYNNDRLKPAPDLLSGHMKRIKLENYSLIETKDNNRTKRKMSVDCDNSYQCTPAKKERKPITWP